MRQWVFDMPHAESFSTARQDFLGAKLPQLIESLSLKTALDAGCGIGHFSAFLAEQGFDVTAFDGRHENVAEAQQRVPTVTFHVTDVEDASSVARLGSFDLVLCFGLLYHLENPFLALANLYAATRSVLLLETIRIPGRAPAIRLIDESHTEDQGLRLIGMCPSDSAVAAMLYRVGFSTVYRFSNFPQHDEFRQSWRRVRRRTLLLAAKQCISLPGLSVVPDLRHDDDAWVTMAGRVESRARALGRRMMGRLRSNGQ